MNDSVVRAVIEAFQQRSSVGQQKYGTTLDRTDLSFKDWVQHMQEELMDAILYLEKLKRVHGIDLPERVLAYPRLDPPSKEQGSRDSFLGDTKNLPLPPSS
jgi:hypothetical protein